MDDTQKDYVWQNRLDGRYDVVVERVSDCEGVLKIFDSEEGNKEIFTKEVGLSYGAMFGPDVEDVDYWSNTVVNFIDNVYDPLSPVDSVE